MEFVGEAGAGMVIVTLNEKGYVSKVDIDEFIYETHDRYMLGDVVACAVNSAFSNMDEYLKTYALANNPYASLLEKYAK